MYKKFRHQKDWMTWRGSNGDFVNVITYGSKKYGWDFKVATSDNYPTITKNLKTKAAALKEAKKYMENMRRKKDGLL